MVCCNQVFVRRIESLPRGRRGGDGDGDGGVLGNMYYNRLHLDMQFMKASRVTSAAAVLLVASHHIRPKV